MHLKSSATAWPWRWRHLIRHSKTSVGNIYRKTERKFLKTDLEQQRCEPTVATRLLRNRNVRCWSPANAQARSLEQMCDFRSVLNIVRTSMREIGSVSERSDYLNKWTRLSFRDEVIGFRCRDIYKTYMYLLTPWSRLFLEKLTGSQPSRNSPNFMEPEGSLPHSHEPDTSPHPKPDQSSPCSAISLLEDHF